MIPSAAVCYMSECNWINAYGCQGTISYSERTKRIATPNEATGPNMLISIPTQRDQNEEQETLTEEGSGNGGPSEGLQNSDDVQIQLIQKSESKVTKVSTFVLIAT